MLSIALAESSAMVQRATQPLEQLARVLFATADTNRDGRITFDEFEAVMMKRPELLRKMTRSEAIWIAPNEEAPRSGSEDRTRAKESAREETPERGWGPRAAVGIWALATVAVFALAWFRGAPGQNPCMQAGRALGRCASFNGALILVPVMRRLLTRLRPTWVGRALSLDDAIDFHRLAGHALFALALAHTGCFAAAFAIGHASSPFAKLVEGERGLTGLALLLVFVVMWVFALEIIRKTNRFELFYFTHLLYFAWLVLAIAHAPSFLLWAGVPLLGILAEQIARFFRRAPEVPVLSSRALRSGVTRLALARPAGFAFSPGDYVFLRIPSIAKREWHPFTISSSPERSELTFHVRSLGNWTAALRKNVEAAEDAPGLVAYVDGPYGSPSAHIFSSRFAVLIGAGIGVTPFASVLETIVLRANDRSRRENAKLEKAYFFWLNKDRVLVRVAFTALLAKLEEADTKSVLAMHLCMTGAHQADRDGTRDRATDHAQAAGRSDMITGLRTQTHMGAPDWEGMLGDIARRHRPEKVDVFFCGPPGLAAKLPSDLREARAEASAREVLDVRTHLAVTSAVALAIVVGSTKSPPSDELRHACTSCHVAEFESAKHHLGEKPSACDGCHSEDSWKGGAQAAPPHAGAGKESAGHSVQGGRAAPSAEVTPRPQTGRRYRRRRRARAEARSRHELCAQKRGDYAGGRSSGVEESDCAGEDVRHAIPFVHLDTVPRSEPQGVVEENLRGPDMDLDGRRSAWPAVERGRAWISAIVVAEVLASARIESRARQLRVVGGPVLDAAAGEREIRPWREQNAAASARFLLEERQSETAAGRVADDRDVSRVVASGEAAIRRYRVVQRRREGVLWSSAVVGDERRHTGLRRDLPGEVAVCSCRSVDEDAAV